MSTQQAEASSGSSEDTHIEQVLEIMRQVLSKPELTADDEAMDHGGTSLSIVRILAETSRALHCDVNPRDLGGAVTARSLVRAAR
ncbi:acyl carrier protein [Streptomyces sp. NPDC005571]|uniref:acyl carrier protein n=1 Tax=Streptomyces sp. NPDC005571 TaxID=3156888 RepID=UPI0033BA9C86